MRIEAADLDGTGHIEECDPPRRLVVSSRETEESARKGGDEPTDQTIEVTLAADGDQTLLTIEVRGLPLQKLAAYGAGWQMHAEDLAGYLAGRAPDDPGALGRTDPRLRGDGAPRRRGVIGAPGCARVRTGLPG